MAAPGWKSALFKSLEKNGKVPYSKFFQLATVRPDGRPANRTVVYRSILDNTDKLTFNTHLRCVLVLAEGIQQFVDSKSRDKKNYP